MCLSTEALILFLSLLPPEIVDVSDSRVVVHAQLRDAIWEMREETWCTAAPRIDAALRLRQGDEA